MWNASHLAVRLCALRRWKRVSMPQTTQSLRHPLTRAFHVAPRLFLYVFVSVPPCIYPLSPNNELGNKKSTSKSLRDALGKK